MKKLLMALAVTLTAGLCRASASDPININSRAASAFYTEFGHAKEVSWKETPKYLEAKFSLNNQVMFAYYSPDGSFIGVVRHLLTTDLPAGLRKSVKKQYGSFWVSELFKLDTDWGTSYYIQLENGTETVVLYSENAGGWKTFSRSDNSGKQAASL